MDEIGQRTIVTLADPPPKTGAGESERKLVIKLIRPADWRAE
jgi:hypothetical protein